MAVDHTRQVVNKAWSFAHLLRDDGLSYMAYTEQITFLLFLKMAHQRTQPPWNRPPVVPAGLDWPSLLARDGEELEAHYRRNLLQAFDVLCGTQHNPPYVAVRIMWRTVRIILLHMRTRRISAT